MSLRAAPETIGRRPAFGTAFLLVAFIVLAPPLFLLIPLLLLLVAARPTTGREWFWIGLAVLGSARLALSPEAGATLPNRIVTAGAATAGGAFVLLTFLLEKTTVAGRALAAVALASAALVGWGQAAGISLASLDQTVLHDLDAGIQLLMTGSPDQEAVMRVAIQIARSFIGLSALQALAGLCLAWAWHQRVSARPLPPGSRPFREFRFNDHVVWGAILTLALAVFPVGASFTRAAQNGLVVWAGLYFARGLAVAQTASHPWSIAGKLLLLALAIMTFPVAIGTLITLGLADTWIDFRRRLGDPEAGGFDAN